MESGIKLTPNITATEKRNEIIYFSAIDFQTSRPIRKILVCYLVFQLQNTIVVKAHFYWAGKSKIWHNKWNSK